MDSTPIVSVIVPAYNRAATIANCLRSIQAQTYQRWEAIAVDDGSRDATTDIVLRLADEDRRIRLVRHDRNRGAQAARNAGIRAAQGEWIAFLDSDDRFLPHSLEVRIEAAKQGECVVVHSECNIIEVDGSTRPYNVPPMAGWVYTRLLEGEGPMFQGLLVSRNALRKINDLDERIVAFQEWDTAIRLARYHRFGFVGQPTFVWDCRNPDTISKDLRRAGRGYEQVFHKHYAAILRHAGLHALIRHYQTAADWYRRAGDRRAMRRCQMMAVVWRSFDPRAILRMLRRRYSSP